MALGTLSVFSPLIYGAKAIVLLVLLPRSRKLTATLMAPDCTWGLCHWIPSLSTKNLSNFLADMIGMERRRSEFSESISFVTMSHTVSHSRLFLMIGNRSLFNRIEFISTEGLLSQNFRYSTAIPLKRRNYGVTAGFCLLFPPPSHRSRRPLASLE